MIHHSTIIALTLLLTSYLPAETTTQPVAEVVGPSDLLRVSILNLLADGTETAFERQVSKSGHIHLLLLPKRIKVEGLTKNQVRDAVVKAYASAKVLSNPSVKVQFLRLRGGVFLLKSPTTQPAIQPAQAPVDVETLFKELVSSDVEKWLRASEKLGKIANQAVVRRLAKMARGGSAEIRPRAVRTMGFVQGYTMQVLPVLVEVAKDKKFGYPKVVFEALNRQVVWDRMALPFIMQAVRRQDGLGTVWRAEHIEWKEIGPAVVPYLLREIENPKSRDWVTYALMEILMELDKTAHPAVGELITSLDASNPYTRRNAAKALGSIGPAAEKATPSLLRLLRGKNGLVATAAAEALGQIGPGSPKVVGALIVSLNRKETRRAAANALGKIGPPAISALEPLIAMLGDKGVYIRHASAEAIGRLGPKARKTLPQLQHVLTDENIEVRCAAALAIWRLTEDVKSVMPSLLGDLRSTEQWNQQRAAETLGEIGPSAAGAVPALIEILGKIPPGFDHGFGQAREAAAIALGRFGPVAKAAILALRKAQSDPRRRVCLAATKALKKIQPATQPALPQPVLEDLGKRLAIRVEADSWDALVKKVKPTFTWGGRDMMWVGQDEKGSPQFTLDRAYVYKPKDKPAKWVLLTDLRFGGIYLPGIAKLHKKKPESDRGSGEYAIVKSTDLKGGTVYEIGWQATMRRGTSLAETERRLFVLLDGKGKWRFLGEGPICTSGKSGGAYCYWDALHSKVAWTGKSDAPVRIKLTWKHVRSQLTPSDAGPIVPKRNMITYRDAVIEGKVPVILRRATKQLYMLAQKGDTFEKIVHHLATWTSGWDTKRGNSRQIILTMWKEVLVRLNPKLPRGKIPEGTRIRTLTYAETYEHLDKYKKAATQPATKPGNKRTENRAYDLLISQALQGKGDGAKLSPSEVVGLLALKYKMESRTRHWEMLNMVGQRMWEDLARQVAGKFPDAVRQYASTGSEIGNRLALVLGEVGGEDNIIFLAKMCANKPSRDLVLALGRTESPRAWPALRMIVTGDDEHLAGLAAETLARAGDKQIIPTLEKWLTSGHDRKRLAGVNAAMLLGAKELVPALRKADPLVKSRRDLLYRAMVCCGNKTYLDKVHEAALDDSAYILESQQKSPDPADINIIWNRRQNDALTAILKLKSPRSLPVLDTIAAGAKDPKVRKRAGCIAEQMRHPELTRQVTALIEQLRGRVPKSWFWGSVRKFNYGSLTTEQTKRLREFLKETLARVTSRPTASTSTRPAKAPARR